MKKAVWVGFVLLSMLVANTGAAFASSAIELISVTNNGGGPTFTFRVSGEFSPNQLKGSGHISGGDDFSLHCQQQDETTVVCHATKKISGQAVSVTFGGTTFWADVPEQRIASGGGGGGNGQYCYSGWSTQYYSNAEINYDLNGNQTGWSINFSPSINTGVETHSICYDSASVPPLQYAQVTHDVFENVLQYSQSGTSFCSVPNLGEGYYPMFCAY